MAGILPATARERPVSLANRSGTLAGTLAQPDSGAVPGVLILAGAGPTDRDGNQPGLRNDSLKKLADGLSACGIASLRVDKRGVAASHDAGFDEEDIHFDDYVTDAVRWLAWLRAQPGIGRIDVLGHSEGALFATLAAQTAPVSRLVLIAGAGRPAGAILRAQLAGDTLAPAIRRRADAIITELEHGETEPDVPPALGMLFRGSVQGYLIDWFKRDPAAELARTSQPALVVQGTTDVQVTEQDARRLAASRHGVELAIFPGMNHVLRAAPADWAANLATYSQPDLSLTPGLVARICGFLH